MDSAIVEILDCTIRDGGYINNWDFPERMVKDVYRYLSKAGVDIIELGFRDASRASPLWRRCPDKTLSEIKDVTRGAKISVMVDFGKATADDFVEAAKSPIDMVRVAVHRNNISGALELIKNIQEKGYLTSIQLMGYPQYSKSERGSILEKLLNSPPHYVYIADSYGTLLPGELSYLVKPFVQENIFKVGFHPHNNLQLAFATTLEAIKNGVHVIDSTLYGMGRGAGNLPTEIIIAYFQRLIEEKYNAIYALLCIDMYLLQLKEEYEWGYQLPYMLSSFAECHPYYAKTMIDARRYTVDDIWRALDLVKQKKPIGYDPSLLEKILESGIFEYDNIIETIADKKDLKTSKPSLEPPGYINRHQGRYFLVLANGPTILKHKESIDKFIEKYNPVVLGANNLKGLYVPDYHAFTNKKRFAKYVSTVDKRSKILLNCYFAKEFVRQYTDREFEDLVFRLGDRNDLTIDNGIISNDCTSVSMLLIAVAYVMGAKEIFVAGMDGFIDKNGSNGHYFYDEVDDSKSIEFNIRRQMWGSKTLKNLDSYLIEHGISGVNIITPTSYEEYYRGIKNFV